MTILIVDDNEQNLYQLQVLLGANGYQVVFAANGTEALAKARQNPPDLVITDILMPGMDGFTLCREWKKDERLRPIPLIFYTATYTDGRDRDFALSLGAERFLVKPEEPETILQTVREVIQQAGRQPAPPSPDAGKGPQEEETGYLQQYNAALIRKLEDKMRQLEQANRDLERDITERQRAEEERLRLQAQLIQAQKLESIGTLAGGVAHEINNPLTGIIYYAQLILDKLGPDSPVAEFASEIGKEAERVASIVKNLLYFARQDKETHCSPARMGDIVDATLSLMLTVMRHDQIALTVDVPKDMPKINCRSQQIQQVIMNLLTNARDALNEKYPGRDADKRMTLTARVIEKGGRPWIRTTVEDRGPGIPVEIRARIFDPFFTTKPRDKGTGLGLSISHGIVRDHGGELSVESVVGEFSRFHFDLPLDRGGEVKGRNTDADPGVAS